MWSWITLDVVALRPVVVYILIKTRIKVYKRNAILQGRQRLVEIEFKFEKYKPEHNQQVSDVVHAIVMHES